MRGVLTIEETAARLRVSPSTVRRLIRAGKLDAHRVTPGVRGTLRVTTDSLIGFLATNAVYADEEVPSVL